MKESTAHNTSTSNHTMDSPDHPTSNLSLLTKDLYNGSSPEPDASNSDQPPLSAFPSESGSVLASDSDLPLPSSTKAKKQTGLSDFFSKIPSEESYARWRKRKHDNEEKDREAYAKRK